MLKQKAAKTAALAWHAAIVRHNGTGCAAVDAGATGACGGPFQAAHIIPKKQCTFHAATVENGWKMCAAHHRRVDTNPAVWARVVAATVGFEQVDDWLTEIEEAHENGLHAAGQRLTPVRWWRAKLVEIDAHGRFLGLSRPDLIPAYVNQWIENNPPTT